MKKSCFITSCIVLMFWILSASNQLLAQGAPPPPDGGGGPGGVTDVPLDQFIFLSLFLGALFGIKKLIKTRMN